MSGITVKKYQHYFSESVRLQSLVNEQAAYIEELEAALLEMAQTNPRLTNKKPTKVKTPPKTTKSTPTKPTKDDIINIMKGLGSGWTFHESSEVNPWAACTASVGREDKDKYERCVMHIKKSGRSSE